MTAAVKVKFGPASDKFSAAVDSYDFNILARRGSGEWANVGWVEVVGMDVSDVLSPVVPFRGQARLNLGSPYMEAVMELGDDADEYDVEVTREGNYFAGTRTRTIRTASEARRMIKAWAVATLETVGWRELQP
tara:strand:- start:465 stop:863 length:399 start_codon:yes stop_codon:yes gene_type:complete